MSAGEDPREGGTDAGSSVRTPQTCHRSGCDNRFEPYRSWQKFCSDSCRKAAWREEKIGAAKQEIVERVIEEVREDVVEAVERAFENLKL